MLDTSFKLIYSGNIRYLFHSSDFRHFLYDHSVAIQTVRRCGKERLARTIQDYPDFPGLSMTFQDYPGLSRLSRLSRTFQETAKPRRLGRLPRGDWPEVCLGVCPVQSRRVRRDCQRSRTLSRPRQWSWGSSVYPAVCSVQCAVCSVQ